MNKRSVNSTTHILPVAALRLRATIFVQDPFSRPCRAGFAARHSSEHACCTIPWARGYKPFLEAFRRDRFLAPRTGRNLKDPRRRNPSRVLLGRSAAKRLEPLGGQGAYHVPDMAFPPWLSRFLPSGAQAHDIFLHLVDDYGGSCCSNRDCQPAHYQQTSTEVQISWMIWIWCQPTRSTSVSKGDYGETCGGVDPGPAMYPYTLKSTSLTTQSYLFSHYDNGIPWRRAFCE